MDVMDAARAMAEDYPGGAKALAQRFDKHPNTFSHELQGANGFKLGLVDAVKASKRAGDPRVLNAFAAEMGYMTLALPETLLLDGSAEMQDLGRMAKEFGDVVQEVTANCTDGDISANDLKGVERQAGELVAAVQQLLHGLRAKHEAGKPPAACK